MAREKVKWCENCAMLEKMYLDAKAMHDTQVGDIRALREENARLRQRVEELERAPRCCADTIPPGCRTCRCADAAEARLAKVVKALSEYVSEDAAFAEDH